MGKKIVKILISVLGTLVLLAGLFAVFNYHLTKILLGNWFGPKINLSKETTWNGGMTYEHIPYAELSEDQYLDLYIPDSDEPLPLMVLIHGGGFYYGDTKTRQTQLMYRYFRDHGYACAAIQYRLSSEAGFPAAVEDVKAAIRFLRANAEQYGYDPDHFITWGESAGGYLSTMAAMTADDEFRGVPFIGEENLKEPVSGKIQVMTEFYGVEEMGAISRDWNQLGIPKLINWASNLWLAEPIKAFHGQYGSCEEVFLRQNLEDMTEEELEKSSALYYVGKNYSKENAIPVMIWHGDADITVPYLESERFAAYCKGVLGKEWVTYRLFPGLGHASDGFYTDESLSEMQAYLDEIIKK